MATLPRHQHPARLAALARMGILDTPPEPAFDDVAELAMRACGTAFAGVCFVDARRQWFKAGRGFPTRETPLNRSLCLRALDHPDPFVVADLGANPGLLTGPAVAGEAPLRFYAGMRLVTTDGHAIGTVCVADGAPRPAGLTATEAASLQALARQAMVLLESRRAASEHEAARRRLRVLREPQTLAWAWLAPDGMLVEASEAALRLFAVPRGPVPDLPLWELPALAADPSLRLRLGGAIGRAGAGETAREKVDGLLPGDRRGVDLRFRPLRDGVGAIEGVLCEAFVPVERRGEAGRRPVPATEALGRLAMTMAHDVNNLLTVVKGAAERLGKPGLPPARQSRHLQAIRDAADGAAVLTGQVLGFARNCPRAAEIFDAGRRLEALREALALLSGASVAIKLRLPARACLVEADPGQFDAALVNMAANARDAMAGAGRMTVSVRTAARRPATATAPAAEGTHIAVTFADTGCGIPPEHLGRLFEPFFTTKAPGRDTGLGLAQVCDFAQGAGGAVGVASVVGRGSTFTLYLPGAKDRRTRPEAAPAA